MNFEREKADILFDYGLLLQFCCHLIQIYTVSSLRTATLRAGVPTGNNEFKQLSVFYGHTKAFYRCSGVYPVFDARCSMPPTSWKDMKMDF